MNDRELMELAAKAASIGGGWGRVETVVGAAAEIGKTMLTNETTQEQQK